MAGADVALVLAAGALNGECPQWCAETGRLYWVDLRAPALHRFDPRTRRDEHWEMPAWIGCYGLGGDQALVALRTGLFRFDFATGALAFEAPPPFDARRFIANDGRCDRQGRFLFGPMYLPLDPGDQNQGAGKQRPLYRYDGGSWTALTPGVQTSNGLAFSPDGRVMYHSDTAAKTIWRCEYDPASGDCENRRVFAVLDDAPADGGPDGATVDRDGFYWCAVFGSGVVRRYDPDGALEREVRVPARYPTMPALGGDDLMTVFVTSANWPLDPDERARHPNEGALFAFEAPVPGLPEPHLSIKTLAAEPVKPAVEHRGAGPAAVRRDG